MVSVKLVSNNNGGYLIRDDKMCDLYLHISPILCQQSVRYLLSSAILRVARKSCDVGHLFLISCHYGLYTEAEPFRSASHHLPIVSTAFFYLA